MLNSLDYPSILIEWDGLLSGLVRNMDGSAVLLFMSASGREGYLPSFHLARDRGLTTVLLTGNRNSPLIPYSTAAVCTNDLEDARPQGELADLNPRLGFFTVVQILIELAAGKRLPPRP